MFMCYISYCSAQEVFFLCRESAAAKAYDKAKSCAPYTMTGLEVFKMRVKIIMACTECKQRNYNTKKNKNNDPDRIALKKYCKFCHRHTVHQETK